MIRRIKKEFETSNILSNSEYNEDTKKLTFTYKNCLNVMITLNIHYPFRPPENLHINARKIYYSKIGNGQALLKYFNIVCLCCESILCPNNWNCTYRFEKIMEEYEIYKTISNGSVVLDYIEKNNLLPSEILHIIARFCGDKL
jgi:hypothetical protein